MFNQKEEGEKEEGEEEKEKRYPMNIFFEENDDQVNNQNYRYNWINKQFIQLGADIHKIKNTQPNTYEHDKHILDPSQVDIHYNSRIIIIIFYLYL